MKQLFESIYPFALEASIDTFSFWDMTFGEINETIKANSRKQEREHKYKAIFDYKLASLVGRNIAAAFDKGNKIPRIYEVYEGFEEVKQEEERLEAEQKWKAIKARMESYNENWKASKGGEK